LPGDGYRREEFNAAGMFTSGPSGSPGTGRHPYCQLLAGRVLKHNVKKSPQGWIDLFMELSETKITLPNGEEGILCIAEDYTDRLRAQENNCRRKNSGTLEMAGAVCHELNQPLPLSSSPLICCWISRSSPILRK